MIIHGMMGLGDNIYQRPFLKAISRPVFLRTPFPEIYEDLHHVMCTKPITRLRTQSKSMQNVQTWYREPVGAAKGVQYGREGLIRGLEHCFGVQLTDMDLPDFGYVQSDIKYAVVRPVTHRTEWFAQSRSPKPEYVAEAAEILRSEGYLIVSVADLQDGEEWAESPLPYADVQYHQGELNTRQLLALIQNASFVVGGVGWIVPAAIAAKVPAWIINGGNGGFNAPEKITDPRMNLSKITFAVPDQFCRCFQHSHNCRKTISNHADKFAEWLRRFSNLVD